MATQYNITHKKIYFPNSWNCVDKYNYDGLIPKLNDFFCYSDTKEERQFKMSFYVSLTGS